MIRPRAITRLVSSKYGRCEVSSASVETFGALTSQPVAVPEADVQRDGGPDDHDDAEPDATVPLIAGKRDVLAEEPGDRGRDCDDRRPCGELLHDHVHPGVGQRH